MPGDLTLVAQADVDAVMDAYADRPNLPIRQGALLELADWQSGMDVTDEQLTQLFRIRHLLGFSALAHRELFHHSGYSNFDTYVLVVQRFKPNEPSTFSFSVRRRDGQSTHFWGSDEFAFHRPTHVDAGAKIVFDEALLAALLELPDSHEHIYEAIVEFNLANTDSADVPDHVEVVMCKSAFEWLLQIDSNVKSFEVALEAGLSGIDFQPSEGPFIAKWSTRWPKSLNLLGAWVRDFCAVRGTSAHGAKKTDFVWTSRRHLAFIAIFFPLLVKKVLADEGLMTLADEDIERLRHIHAYLAHDPFDFDWHSGASHPWSEARSQETIAMLAKRLYPDWK
ncbi:hypothetical protein K788_00003715 [Paraburkholderia caribensis MBA4]|uniref:Apea-like HEPN domain-containing protein n=1 Tax=Paraburkholderia caribensis MBA4 TaxID=1323664 RepID=A0A0N7JV51_9BURK|nr:hypothetical protein K788_00003715 [Paraburkholderia caribensis MBA4]